MIKSNTEKDIKEITSKSYGHMKEPEAAIKELCKLKGVGPATASGELRNIFISKDLLQELISLNLLSIFQYLQIYREGVIGS